MKVYFCGMLTGENVSDAIKRADYVYDPQCGDPILLMTKEGVFIRLICTQSGYRQATDLEGYIFKGKEEELSK